MSCQQSPSCWRKCFMLYKLSFPREEKREVICHTILGGKRSGSSVLHISLPEEMSFHCLTFPKIYCFLSCHPLLIL
ncbi:hypothetical protein O3P69_013352 [Scylla paramamosain]|uniref:Uncharacterized protein n=1 Tax=Scylla paramamosain TaxID=85552 RepID=A0AAW0U0H7_SCYPA